MIPSRNSSQIVRTLLLPAVVAAVAVALALLAAVAPLAAAGVAVLIVIGALARSRGPVLALTVLAGVVACTALVTAAAAWPSMMGIGAIVAIVLLLAWRAPEWALAAAVLLFGFEGSIKILLRSDPAPLPFSARAVGAAAIDVALLAAIVGVLAADRGASLGRLWREMRRPERVVLQLVIAWLALSAVQIAVGGHLSRGVHGFRLFQAYLLVAVATVVVFRRVGLGNRVRVALGIGFVVAAYAAFRVVFGPTQAEFRYAISVDSVVSYGKAVRAIGSFSSAVGMSSYLVPVAVFALVSGLLMPRVRLLAWATAALALVGVVGSYGRAGLVGAAVGLVVAVGLSIGRNQSRRTKATAAVLLIVALGAAYGGAQVASHASPQLRERVHGILNPLGDESVKIRLRAWKRAGLAGIRSPFGEGLGAVGAASAPVGKRAVTTDNSFLKVLVEQGVVGAALFYAAMLGALVVLGHRVRRAPEERRAVGTAALGGLVAFLVLAATGETVEQPGKVVAWALLGIAAATAFSPVERETAAA